MAICLDGFCFATKFKSRDDELDDQQWYFRRRHEQEHYHHFAHGKFILPPVPSVAELTFDSSDTISGSVSNTAGSWETNFTITNFTFRVQFITNLANPNWQDLGQAVFQFTDTNAVNNQTGFYRLVASTNSF